MKLIEEAQRRGFVKGVYFISAGGNLRCYIDSCLILYTVYDTFCIKTYSGMGCIYTRRMVNGLVVEKWATIVE